MTKVNKVLFITQEITPYVADSEMALIGRNLPSAIQDKGREIRTFMPKWGDINERRNQLHEVIRLSGMNLIIDDTDHPLIIKVASIQSSRMQVYFIDNDDYFHKKFIYTDNEGNFLEDNDERAIFFARGILETVKKLRWKPDIVHCSGWISHLLPLYLKKAFKNDPIFADAKVVLSLYDEYMDSKFNPDMKSKIPVSGIKSKDLDAFKAADGINLAKLAIQYADAVILGSENIRPELMEFSASRGIPVLQYFPIDHPEGTYIQKFNEFYDKLLE